MYNLNHEDICTSDNLLLKLSQYINWTELMEIGEIIWTPVRGLNVRELSAKWVCILPFITYNKGHIVTMITSNVSGVTILININLYVYKIMVAPMELW